jgi:hypothetical protein
MKKIMTTLFFIFYNLSGDGRIAGVVFRDKAKVSSATASSSIWMVQFLRKFRIHGRWKCSSERHYWIALLS